MKKLFVLVGVLALLVVVVLVISPRGPDRGSGSRYDALELIDGLSPERDTGPADLAGVSCRRGGDIAGFEIAPGGVCQARLPSRVNRMTFCLEQGQLTAARIKGRHYPAQSADLGRLGCELGGERFRLYDENSVLVLSCVPLGAACRIRLLS